MKQLVLCLSFCVAVNLAAFAQGTVPDTHPTAAIFAIDYSTGQETEFRSDAAILFKNSLIDLVSNTTVARMQMARMVPGRKAFVVTQMDPQTNGNAYQLVLQNRFLNRNTPLYTFIYSVDQNTLSFLDQQSGRYIVVPVQGANINNLNNCANYGTFNLPPPPAPAAGMAPPQAIAANNADAMPIDADVSANIAPPALPDYEQPECPVDGYLWQPGYWAYTRDTNGYYWVPGAWVAPPDAGLLWTPPYWGFDNGLYVFHTGYWGPSIGFYGGVNYGYGYGGTGYVGGNWYNGHFRYNTAVVRVNVGVIRNVYVDRSVVVVRENGPRVSFNGRGGVMARPNERELAAMRERHVTATPEQIRNQRAAREDKGQFASANGGRPANVASPRAMEPRNNPGQDGRPGMNNDPRGNSGRPEVNNNNPNNNGRQNNTAGGRPNMNNGQPNNNGQQNNAGGRPNMNGGTQPANNAASGPAANAVGGQGTRPGGYGTPNTNGAPNANAPQGANTNGQPANRSVTGGTPPSNPNAPGSRPSTGGTPPSSPNANGGRQAQGTRTNTQQQKPQQQQRQRTPPPEKKPV